MTFTDPQTMFQEAMRIHKAGEHTRAEKLYKRLLKNHPDHPEVVAMLGRLYVDRKQDRRGIDMMRRAMTLAPHSPNIHFWLGIALIRLKRDAEALEILERAAKLAPKDPEIRFQLGRLAAARFEVEPAIEHLSAAATLAPDNEQYRFLLAVTLAQSGRRPVGLSHFQWLIQRQPNNPHYHLHLGHAQQVNGALQDAVASYETALRLSPGMLEAVIGIANIEESWGQREEAYVRLKDCLAQGQRSPTLAMAFARVCTHRKSPEEARDPLESILRDDQMTTAGRIAVLFRLGQLNESVGRYDDAWACYAEANGLHPKTWDGEDHERGIDRLVQTFSPEAFDRMPRARNQDASPIFIVGMYRSGTTLLEQILACHPHVHAAGELTHVHRVALSLPQILGAKEDYPECVTQLTVEIATDIAETHLDRLRQLRGTRPRVTDKFPMNYLHIGLIRLLFPEATIINTVRDPVDTCLSCYANAFSSALGFTTSLTELGRTYRQYDRLMKHWRETLGVPLLTVRYEELVEDLEKVIREVLEYCRLPWDSSCLRFFESKRVALTPSEGQVRQPIFRSSLARSSHFTHHLQELVEALNQT